MMPSIIPSPVNFQYLKTWAVDSPVKETNLLHYPLDRDLSGDRVIHLLNNWDQKRKLMEIFPKFEQKYKL